MIGTTTPRWAVASARRLILLSAVGGVRTRHSADTNDIFAHGRTKYIITVAGSSHRQFVKPRYARCYSFLSNVLSDVGQPTCSKLFLAIWRISANNNIRFTCNSNSYAIARHYLTSDVCLCLPYCQKPILRGNVCTNQADFLAWRLCPIILHCVTTVTVLQWHSGISNTGHVDRRNVLPTEFDKSGNWLDRHLSNEVDHTCDGRWSTDELGHAVYHNERSSLYIAWCVMQLVARVHLRRLIVDIIIGKTV